MNRSLITLISALSFCVSNFPGYSQQVHSFDSLSTDYAVNLFQKANAKQSRLNNGREYVLLASNINGHPFYESRSWTSGDLHYDGVLFKNVEMLYDLYLDELIVQNFAITNNLRLVKQKVKEFRLLHHQFIYLENTPGQVSREGFYDQLYHGELAVLAKRKKVIEVSRNATLDTKFLQEDQYYLLKDGVLFPVKSKGSVLKLLKDKKSEVLQFMRKEGILFRQNPEQAMVLIAGYYDQISK
jgi:hypothetical protein